VAHACLVGWADEHACPVVDPRSLGSGAGGDLLPRLRRNGGGAGIGTQLAQEASGRGEHPLVDRDREHIRHAPPNQKGAQLGLLAVHLITGDPLGRYAGVHSPGEHCHSQLGLGRELHPITNPGLGTTLPVGGPRRRQVELPVQERRTQRRRIGQEHPDLSVLDPSRRARVLPGHPGGLGALLQEPRLIDHQHTPGVAQVLHDILTQIITDQVSIPVGRHQQPLHPIRAGLPSPFGQRPGVLTLHRRQQTTHVRGHTPPRLGPGEPRPDPGMNLRQTLSPRRYLTHIQIIDHPGTIPTPSVKETATRRTTSE
jgi:hypothetical protein